MMLSDGQKILVLINLASSKADLVLDWIAEATSSTHVECHFLLVNDQSSPLVPLGRGPVTPAMSERSKSLRALTIQTEEKVADLRNSLAPSSTSSVAVFPKATTDQVLLKAREKDVGLIVLAADTEEDLPTLNDAVLRKLIIRAPCSVLFIAAR